MQRIGLSPFNELQNISQNFNGYWGGSSRPASVMGISPMDMYEVDGNLVARVNLPNFKKDEVRVRASERTLEVSAFHRELSKEGDKRRYYLRESSNQYFRRVPLPRHVRANQVSARFQDGVLKVYMPVAERSSSQSVFVK